MLDGLDEVRPQIVGDAYEAIAAFYSSFFYLSSTGRLIVTCRKEAYRSIPLAISEIWEALPLKDQQIQIFAKNWPLDYPKGRSADEFWSDLSASEKILEVSRSPLLLIGSLLLYTETGLGIPGQRVKYLDKIKRTLIEDWTTAQGQPPDPLRDAYTPVLTAIALRMHMRPTAELPRSECIDFLKEFLPSVGLKSESAEGFLDSLAKRTGILVRNVPSYIIFVHFTLQEFFASLQLAASFEAEQIATLEPKTWWREAILFTVAQKPDPTNIFGALFTTSPAIAVLAVSEAPTPSLLVQETAVRISLEQLDSGSKEFIPALVALLRKVSGRLSQELGYALEQRLDSPNQEVTANVTQIFATAGTDFATDILSKHSNTWRYCLENAGLLIPAARGTDSGGIPIARGA